MPLIGTTSILACARVDSIPTELKSLTQWVCWQELATTDGKKPGKKLIDATSPYSAYHQWAKSNDPTTWASFHTALTYLELLRLERLRCGLSFALPLDRTIVGIDLDNCRNPITRGIDPRAIEIIKRFGSYTEISPSGKGIRIFLHGRLPKNCRHRQGRIEIYDQSRFLSVTGYQIHDHGAGATIRKGCIGLNRTIKEWHKEVFGTIARQFHRKNPTSPNHIVLNHSPTLDQQQLEKLFQGNQRAKDIFDGDWHKHGYPSQSEADLALANSARYRYWTPQQICDLIVIARYNGGSESKHPSYYAATISRAKYQLIQVVGEVY